MSTKKDSIAAIGQGFVGSAFTTGMCHAFDVYVYDKAGKVAEGGIGEFHRNNWEYIDDINTSIVGTKRRPQSIREFVIACENQPKFLGIYSVAVPTPMMESGECDTTIVESVIQEIADVTRNEKNVKRIVMLKSTVPPGSVDGWNRKFNDKGVQIVHNPEFLTERNALNDFKNQDRIVLGGPKVAVNRCRDMYSIAYPNVPVVKTSAVNAEMNKYVINTFLATKVSFANEIYQICEKLKERGEDVDYDRIVEIASLDKRLGTSHWKVPGPMPSDDEKRTLLRGFAGSCFIKDIHALMHEAETLGVDPKVLKGAWSKNVEVRPEKDWLNLVGRAVSIKK